MLNMLFLKKESKVASKNGVTSKSFPFIICLK